MKLPLITKTSSQAFRSARIAVWRDSEPFVENKKGVLIHRPRQVEVYFCLRRSHLAIKHWCGNGHTGREKFTFLAVPPEGRIVCAHCEANAIEAGYPSSSELAGRHVCIGGVKAISSCHPELTYAH